MRVRASAWLLAAAVAGLGLAAGCTALPGPAWWAPEVQGPPRAPQGAGLSGGTEVQGPPRESWRRLRSAGTEPARHVIRLDEPPTAASTAAAASTPASTAAPPAPTAAPPASTPPAADEVALRGALLDRLHAQLQARPLDDAVRHRLALEYQAAGDPVEAHRVLEAQRQAPGAPMAWGLARAMNHLELGEEDRAAEALEAALGRLRRDGPLAVRQARFCTRVLSYGVYTPFKADVFQGDQPVLVYLELEHFACAAEAALYRVDLDVGLEVTDRHGTVRWERPEFQRVEHRTTSPLRDFFLALTGLRVPRGLDPGPHRYTVRVRDRIKDSSAEVSLPFEVR
ncbi:MAG: hypothetical protein HY722_07790 [Planctomycetes bacterium]|nr:hypothetical protein [Planctomycetota bacterium]